MAVAVAVAVVVAVAVAVAVGVGVGVAVRGVGAPYLLPPARRGIGVRRKRSEPSPIAPRQCVRVGVRVGVGVRGRRGRRAGGRGADVSSRAQSREKRVHAPVPRLPRCVRRPPPLAILRRRV